MALDSPGGDFDTAIELGRLIRARGLDTAVAELVPMACPATDPGCGKAAADAPEPGRLYWFGECSHECLLVLGAGARRFTHRVNGAIFPHSASFVSSGKAAPMATLDSYFREMSLDPDLLKSAMRALSPSSLRLASAEGRMKQHGFESLGTPDASPVRRRAPPRRLPPIAFCGSAHRSDSAASGVELQQHRWRIPMARQHAPFLIALAVALAVPLAAARAENNAGHGAADNDYDGVKSGPTIDLHARYPGDKSYPFGNSRVAGPDRGPYVERCYWTATPNQWAGFFFPSDIKQTCVRYTQENTQ